MESPDGCLTAPRNATWVASVRRLLATVGVVLVSPKGILTASRSTASGDPGERFRATVGVTSFILMRPLFEQESSTSESLGDYLTDPRKCDLV